MTADAGPLVADAALAAALGVVGLALLALYRVVRGPTFADRVLAVNGVGTATVVVLVLLAAGTRESGLLDVALVYALLNVLLSLGLARYALEGGTRP